jgi:AhpD family alkylhydroperoxidase
MAKQFNQIIKDVDGYAIELRALIPETLKAFGEMSRAAQKPGALDRKTKELIALAIAVSGRCDACIAYHARGAGKAGASRQEVAETLAVAIQMGGGPAVNYATDALRAYDEFAPTESHAIAS